MRDVRRLGVLVTWVLSTGCPREAEQALPEPLGTGDATSGIPVGENATATATMTAPATSTKAGALEEEATLVPVATVEQSCAKQTPWVSSPPCQLGPYAFAVGVVQGVRAPSLAREAAAGRARRALAERLSDEAEVVLRGSEVAAVKVCGKQTFALVRVPATPTPALAECSSAVASAAAGD